MNIETTEELAEKLADWFGLYGGCKSTDENGAPGECLFKADKPFCCRQGFCGAIQQRMIASVQNDNKLEFLNQFPHCNHEFVFPATFTVPNPTRRCIKCGMMENS